MSYEILGSFLIYGYVSIFKEKSQNKLFIFIIFLILFYNQPFISCFILGLSLATNHIRQEVKFNNTAYAMILIILVVFLSLTQLDDSRFLTADQKLILIGYFFIFSITKLSVIKNFFSNKFSQFLGKISFILYLIQIPIICSYTSFMYLLLSKNHEINFLGSIFIIISTIIISIALSRLLMPIENFSLIFSKHVGLKLNKINA
jgi:peptidoglycan/LPS O-acetylase OafA/YrhL